jgi:hypothetical protein
MLYEIKNVSQYKNELKRRWFFDHDIDLTVWVDLENRIDSFQLCYDKIQNFHALTWKKNFGFKHNRVDDGEDLNSIGNYKSIPILLMDGHFEKERIIEIFSKNCLNIPKFISKFVLEKLMSY